MESRPFRPSRLDYQLRKRNMQKNELAARIKEIGNLGTQISSIAQLIGEWTRGVNYPGADYIAYCAVALDVSTDYLLGISNIEKPFQSSDLNQREQELLFAYRHQDYEKIMRLSLSSEVTGLSKAEKELVEAFRENDLSKIMKLALDSGAKT